MQQTQSFIFRVTVLERQNGQDLPQKDQYFQEVKAAKTFAQINTRFFARHSWRKASIKAIPV